MSACDEESWLEEYSRVSIFIFLKFLRIFVSVVYNRSNDIFQRLEWQSGSPLPFISSHSLLSFSAHFLLG